MRSVIARTFYRLAGGNASIPVTLGLRNIYVLPTGYGLLYLMGVVAMLIGSVNYNNNLGFLLTFLLGSLGLSAMLHTYSMLYGIRLLSTRAMSVFAGEPVEVEAHGRRYRSAANQPWLVFQGRGSEFVRISSRGTGLRPGWRMDRPSGAF